MNVIATAVTVGFGVAILYWVYRSYVLGIDKFNGELLD
jgi:hypothetical protein